MKQRPGKTPGMIAAHVLSALIVGWLLVLPSTLFAAPPEMHDDIATVLREEGLTGVVWATVDTDGAIAVDAAGVRDARSGELLEAGDRVHIGSIAKPLLATGLLRLVSEGRVALDTPVSEVLTDVVFDNPWAASDPVRIRHLLDHTSGLDDLHLWQFFSTRPEPDTPLARAFAAGDTLLLFQHGLHPARSDRRSGYRTALRALSRCAVAAPARHA